MNTKGINSDPKKKPSYLVNYWHIIKQHFCYKRTLFYANTDTKLVFSIINNKFKNIQQPMSSRNKTKTLTRCLSEWLLK